MKKSTDTTWDIWDIWDIILKLNKINCISQKINNMFLFYVPILCPNYRTFGT